MTITPDILAKLIFATSELRYFEKELVMEPNNELQDIVIKCQHRLDSILVEMGMDKFIALEDIKMIIKTLFNAETNTEKEISRMENA